MIHDKEDLHDWTIFRQALTSSIAEGLFRTSETVHRPEETNSTESDSKTAFRMIDHPNNDHLADRGQGTFLRFGLPRVAVSSNGQFTLQRPTTMFSSGKIRSELDLRPISRANGGPLSSSSPTSDSPDNVIHHYAQSELMASQNYEAQNGVFLRSKRHHAPYFSNIDVFRRSDERTFNYLRYAKAEQVGSMTTKKMKPRIKIVDLKVEFDTRSTLDVAMLRTPKFAHVVGGISMQLFAGDTLALLYTSETEVRTFLRVLANEDVPHGRVEGIFELNGNRLRPSAFADRIALVSDRDPYHGLTVRQHLHTLSSFVRPATNAFRTSHMIGQLIRTLALTPFRDKLVNDLGKTEKRRVSVAGQILLDTDVLICDNITREMDLYDAAFVIDYLRDWAMKLHRIVIMAISPPSYEILTMFYKTAILASGRLVYLGRSQQMIDYFESIDYPCPKYKNPCDYYVDLVTKDHLTMEACEESTERINHLADVWLKKEPKMTNTPIDAIPSRVRRVNLCLSLIFLYKRFWMLFFNRPWEYVSEIVASLLLSLLMGMIFFELDNDRQAGINDRFGLAQAIVTLCLLPNLLQNIERVFSERELVHPETRIRLYDKPSFLIAKIVFDLPMAIIVYGFYTVPVYFLAKSQPIDQSRWTISVVFCSAIILHGFIWRYLSWAFAYAFRRKFVATFLLSLLLYTSALSSGVTVQNRDQWSGTKLLRVVSPAHWAIQLVVSDELLGNSSSLESGPTTAFRTSELIFDCKKKKVLATKIADVPIYTVSRCSQTSGRQAYHFGGLGIAKISIDNRQLVQLVAFLTLTAWVLVSLVLCFCFIFCNHEPTIRLRHRE